MNPEEIKVGDKIIAELLVIGISNLNDEFCITCEAPTGTIYSFLKRDFEALSPANGIKHTEPATKVEPTAELFAPIKKLEKLPQNFPFPEPAQDTAQDAPKYDPNRKFREGDIVEPCSVKGRWLSEAWKNRKGIHYEVTSDEDDDCVMWVQDADSLHPKDVEAVFFQLVTPVEELELYEVRHNEAHAAWSIYGPYNLSAVNYFYGERYPYTEATAKAAAEAECARLNEAYRKEQK